MKMEWKDCLKVGASIFLLYLCIYYWPGFTGLVSMLLGAALPLLIGCIVAYLVNILMSFYERHYFVKSGKKIVQRSRRPVCMSGAFLTLILIIALLIRQVIPQLVSCVQLVFAQLPGFMEMLIDQAEKLDLLPEDLLASLEAVDWNSRIGEIIRMLTSGIGSVMDVVFKAVSKVFSGAVTGFLSIIFSVYLLAGKEKLGGQCRRVLKHYLRENWYKKAAYVAGILDDCFHRYIVGQCLEAVILGVLCTGGMLLLQLPYATMIGALIAFTALIPVAGAYIGAGVGAFIILMDSPVKAFIFLAFIVILQQVEGNLIYPRVVGSSLGLPGIWVLAAVTVGGGILGVAGMLFGVPLTAVLYRILRDDLNRPAKRMQIPNEQKAGEQKTGEQKTKYTK